MARMCGHLALLSLASAHFWGVNVQVLGYGFVSKPTALSPTALEQVCVPLPDNLLERAALLPKFTATVSSLCWHFTTTLPAIFSLIPINFLCANVRVLGAQHSDESELVPQLSSNHKHIIATIPWQSPDNSNTTYSPASRHCWVTYPVSHSHVSC